MNVAHLPHAHTLNMVAQTAAIAVWGACPFPLKIRGPRPRRSSLSTVILSGAKDHRISLNNAGILRCAPSRMGQGCAQNDRRKHPFHQ